MPGHTLYSMRPGAFDQAQTKPSLSADLYAQPGNLQRAADAGFQPHLSKLPALEKLEQLLAEAPAAANQILGPSS